MNTLEKFKMGEDIKDRYATMFMNEPGFACLSTSIDKSSELLVKTIEQFENIKKEQGLKTSIYYLMDVLGYYMMLCNDVLTQNQELIDLLKQIGD